MTRRELLFGAAAATFIRADPAHPKNAHLSAINDEIGSTLNDTIAFARQYGVRWLEMRGAQVAGKAQYVETLDQSRLAEIARQLSGNGLRVSVLDSSLMKVTLPGTQPIQKEDFYVKYFAQLGLDDETLFRDRLEILKRSMDAAHALGTKNLRVFGFWRVQEPAQVLPRVAECMSEMADLARMDDCRLLIENEYSTNVATSDETAEMMRLVKSPALGINWDPQNAIAFEPEPFPSGYAKLPKDRIFNVHVKAEGLFGPKHPLDWGAIMKAMLKDGYSGTFSLETHRGHDEKNVAASHQCMEKMVRLITES